MIWPISRSGDRLALGLELADNLPTRSGGSHDSFDISQDRLLRSHRFLPRRTCWVWRFRQRTTGWPSGDRWQRGCGRVYRYQWGRIFRWHCGYRQRRHVCDRGLFWRASDIPGDAGTE
jgi:hypothetical protein